MPRRERDGVRLTDAVFDGATFENSAAFVGVTLAGETCVREATFAGRRAA